MQLILSTSPNHLRFLKEILIPSKRFTAMVNLVTSISSNLGFCE